MVVASAVNGRVRIRDDSLKREAVVERIRDQLLADEGVNDVLANSRVGSLLVLYDAASTALEKILKTISELLGTGEESATEPPPEQKPRRAPLMGRISLAIPRRVKKNFVNVGMLTSLVLSVAAIIFHLKKLHAVLGIIFVALFADHFYQRKEYMLA